MKLEPATELDKRNTATSEKFDNAIICWQTVMSLSFFVIYGQFAAIQIPDSGLMAYKIFSLTITFYLTKTDNRTKKYLLWVKILFLPKNTDFLQKNADISTIEGVFVLQVCSIILVSYKQEEDYTNPNPNTTYHKMNPLKSPL